MRTLLIAYLLVCAAPTFAQGLLLPEGATGVSASVATSLNDGVSDVGVGLCATPSPSVDLSAVVGRSPLGSGGLTTVGGAFALNIDRDSPSRAAVLAGISFVSGEQFDTAYVISVGARAGRQIPLGAARAVPNLSVNVSLFTGGNVERGVQAGASFDLPVIFGVEAVSFSVAPSVSLNSEYLQYAEGLDRFIIGLRGAVLFGTAR